MGSRSKGRRLPSFYQFICIMLTLTNFSKKLYDFHLNKPEIKSLRELLENARSYFIDILNDLDPKELAYTSIRGGTLDKKKTSLIAKCTKVIDESEKVIRKYEDSARAEGIEDFYKIFFHSDKALDIANVQEISPRNFFRMRTTKENIKYEFFKRKQIFMIPEEDNRFISKARFNNDGQPCLYLASSLFLAWEECRRPDFNLVNFSLFRNVRTLKVMRISIATRMKTIGDFIMGYFTMLCCMKAQDENKHNFQYTVPNLFMQILFMNIRRGGDLDGICYLSSRRFECEDFLFDHRHEEDAYVFPPKERTPTGVCPKLSKLFVLTKPKTYFLFKTHRFTFDTKTAFTSDYKESLFAMIEKQLESDVKDLDYYDK